MTDTIEKALKRLENAEIKVCVRGGQVVKIPKQEVSLATRDGVQSIYKINEDIT